MSEKKKPVLSIGMIFKNEIRCLERCMKSLQPLRDAVPCELVMADTGSDDGSRQIAEKYADVVFDFPWIGDFAAARNAVMDRCSGTWYFSIDCDEWLDSNVGGFANFVLAKQSTNFGAVIVRNYATDELERGGNYSDFMAMRVLRMSTGLRYEGKIHERWNADSGVQAVMLDKVILHHDGYVNNDRWKKKQERNMPMLHKKLEENPEDLLALLQCIESGGRDPNYLVYLRRGVEGIEKRWDGWKAFGPAIFRTAVQAAINLNLPERDKWLEMAEKTFPDNIFIRVDVMYCGLSYSWKQENYKECICRGEAYLNAVRDYQAGQYNYSDILASALVHAAPRWAANASIILAASYINEKQPEECMRVLQTISDNQLDDSQAVKWLRTLCQLHAKSDVGTKLLLLKFWNQNLKMEDAEKIYQRRLMFADMAADMFVQAYRDEEGRLPDFHRYAYTVFLPLAGKCELGTAAAILEETEPAKLEKLLSQVEKWDEFPIAALEYALEQGAAFPLPGRPLKLEEMDKLAGRMSEVRETLTVQVAGQDLTDWQSLTWARGLALAAIQGCKWKDEAQGLALSRAFAGIEGTFLPRYYAPELLEGENIRVLPPLHRFGWYCARAFRALDAGDAAGYARLLREGLSSCEAMKPMAEFLTMHTPELHTPAPSAELLSLAEQVRTLLASFDPSDPAVAAVKASEAYQKVAHLVEGTDAGGLPS